MGKVGQKWVFGKSGKQVQSRQKTGFVVKYLFLLFLDILSRFPENLLLTCFSWSPYTDHNPIEVRLAKSWVFRAACRPIRRLKRPNWRVLRGSGEGAQTARAALSAELEPNSWSEVVDLGLGVARAVLGDEPYRNPRPG